MTKIAIFISIQFAATNQEGIYCVGLIRVGLFYVEDSDYRYRGSKEDVVRGNLCVAFMLYY